MCGNYHSTNVLQQDMQNFGRNVTSTPFLRFGDDLGFNGDSQIVVPQTRVLFFFGLGGVGVVGGGMMCKIFPQPLGFACIQPVCVLHCG